MSLAEELLADLEEEGGDEEEVKAGGLDDIPEEIEDVEAEMKTDTSSSIKNVAKLRDSEQVILLFFQMK